jgi:hypothetical protein
MPPKHKLLRFSQEHLHEGKERKEKKKTWMFTRKGDDFVSVRGSRKTERKGDRSEGRVSQEKKQNKKKGLKGAARVSEVKKGDGRRRRRMKRWLMAMGVVVEPKPKTVVVVVGHLREAEIGGDRKG